MKCNIVKDLIPLYIDDCCSEESKNVVEDHIRDCDDCRKLTQTMKSPPNIITVSKSPQKFSKLSQWKASVLQSALFFVSFALITIGVSLEASTPLGLLNGFWAFNLVIPSTGFMLSLANWYFVRVYKSRKSFSNCSLIATAVITAGAYIWSAFHYEMNLLFSGEDFAAVFEILHALFLLNSSGILLTAVFCALSKILSNQYAKMLGKE